MNNVSLDSFNIIKGERFLYTAILEEDHKMTGTKLYFVYESIL